MFMHLWICILLSFSTLSVVAQSVPLEGMAAVVGSEIISQRDVAAMQEKVRFDSHDQVMLSYHQARDRLVQMKLQEIMAARMGIEISDQALHKALDQLAQNQQLSSKDYRASIEKDGVSWSEHVAQVKQKLLLMSFQKQIIGLHEDVGVSYQQWLVKHQGDFTGLKLDYWHFPVDAPDGDPAWQQAQQQAMAWKHSLQTKMQDIEPPHAATLHHEPMKALNQLPDLWVQAWQAHPQDRWIGPIETGNGYHVLVVQKIAKPNASDRVGFDAFMNEKVASVLPQWLERAEREIYIRRYDALV